VLLRRPLWFVFALVVTLVAAGFLAAHTAPRAHAATPDKSGIVLGVVGDVAQARKRTGQNLAIHHYGYFEEARVEDGAMLTVRFKSRSWASTASLQAGSTGHQQIVRYADQIKARGDKIFVAFHAEPEASAASQFGTPAEFKAAYRKVVSIFRARGATNAMFTWQMTAWAFRAGSDAHQYAPRWYPGDAYVDVVGADPYNWYTCGHGLGRWNPLKQLVDPVLAFARQHGKQVALPEFASMRHSKRPGWIREAGSYLAANDDVVAAAFYFQHLPTNSANSDCTWPLSTDADWSALRDVASRAVFRP